ncbi:MAG TPA: LamG-like jellyroll fold domain-containing protein [Kofleriaceae bacterium]|jgi:hypothetical protein|nr:LamG-like jellyroll fold domain-containing protein [Kofleriaceae bacterium]
MRGCFVVLALAGCSFSPGQATVDASLDAFIVPGDVSASTIAIQGGLQNQTELDNFPALLTLPSTLDLSSVTDPNHGFTFVDTNGNSLDYEVEHWDPQHTSSLWVRLQQVLPDQDDFGRMTWGPNQSAAQPFSTWSGYTQVLHFDTVAAADSAGTEFEPMPTNITTRAGQIGNAAGFGSSSQIAFSDGNQLYSHWQAFTLQFWLYVDATPVDQVIGVMDQGSDAPLSDGNYDPFLDAGDFQLTWTFDDTETRITTLPIPRQTWTLLAITWDGTNMTGYVNGAAKDLQFPAVTPNRLALAGALDSFVLGNAEGNAMSGAIDELEVDRVAHTADWIAASYVSQTGGLAATNDLQESARVRAHATRR